MKLYFLGIFTLFLSGIFSLFLNKNLKIKILSLFTFLGTTLVTIPAINTLSSGEILVKPFTLNFLYGNINFVIDTLSAFFIIFIAIMSFLSIIYSNGYLKPYLNTKTINSHLLFLPMLVASMLLVVTCQNALMFLICWEIMSLSSFFLVIFENNKKEVLKAGIKYIIFMHVSVLFIILTFAILSIKSGSFDFSSFKTIMGNNSILSNIIFLLAFIGFGTKAGFVPFHNWLPEAHPVAPSHVSAIMSAVMIKTGIYGILRFLYLIGTPSKFISYVVLLISLVTAIYGVLYAITQKDVKKMLAYSSIENIGIIGIGIGVGMIGLTYKNPTVAILGFSGGILHILNHSIFKELLFLSAGSVYLKTHTKNMEILGGLIKNMPYTSILFLLGSISICALPPLNGFISEFLIYIGMFNGLSIHHFTSMVVLLFTISGLALVGTMALLCFTKAFSIIFLGLPRSEACENVKSDADISMIIPMCILALFSILIGILPQYVLIPIVKSVSSLIPNFDIAIYAEQINIITIISKYSAILLSLLALIIFLKIKLTKGKIVFHQTWGCGYNRANNRMQYSASSYASPFLSMLKPLFKKVFDIEKPKKLFPKNAHFSLHIEDIEQAYILNPLLKFDEWFLSKFETLQSGNIQSYIKYGLIFLVIVIIGSIFIG